MTDHECQFPEMELEAGDEDGNLKAGMRVLAPCRECGNTPLDELEFMQGHAHELEQTLLRVAQVTWLYHWSPTARRKQITRYGVMPHRRPTTNTSLTVNHSCWADNPRWAWALSGGMPWTPSGEWDLWQTRLDLLDESLVHVLPSADGIHEVRVEGRVWKRHVWLVGQRTKN